MEQSGVPDQQKPRKMSDGVPIHIQTTALSQEEEGQEQTLTIKEKPVVKEKDIFSEDNIDRPEYATLDP